MFFWDNQVSCCIKFTYFIGNEHIMHFHLLADYSFYYDLVASFICLPMLRSYVSIATTVTVGISPFFHYFIISLFWFGVFMYVCVHLCLGVSVLRSS